MFPRRERVQGLADFARGGIAGGDLACRHPVAHFPPECPFCAVSSVTGWVWSLPKEPLARSAARHPLARLRPSSASSGILRPGQSLLVPTGPEDAEWATGCQVGHRMPSGPQDAEWPTGCRVGHTAGCVGAASMGALPALQGDVVWSGPTQRETLELRKEKNAGRQEEEERGREHREAGRGKGEQRAVEGGTERQRALGETARAVARKG